MKSREEVQSIYKHYFAAEPLIVCAPGRINLIGEHTDYNNGFVMPGAIDLAAYIAIASNSTDHCRLIAYDINEEYTFHIGSELIPVENEWVNYFLGVLAELT